MLLSRRHSFIFIHIQKTGGSSVERALADAVPDVVRAFVDLPACHDPLKRRHLFASDLADFLGPTEWRGFYKFAFVRNPWSRLVSWYRMCVTRPSNPFMHFVRDNAPTFEAFLQLTEGPARKTTFNQVDYLTDASGGLLVDFVGRFERLSDDFEHARARIGVTVALPHVNKGESLDYCTFYTDATRTLVATRFARDIAAFGYAFGD